MRSKIVGRVDTKEFEKLLTVYHEVSSHLAKRSTEDPAYDVSPVLDTSFIDKLLCQRPECTRAHCCNIWERTRARHQDHRDDYVL